MCKYYVDLVGLASNDWCNLKHTRDFKCTGCVHYDV